MGKITTIGTGDAFSTGGRFQSCFLVKHQNGSFLVDCGANAYLGLVRTVPNLDDIANILITHFHGDHYGGLPFFLINRKFFSHKKKLLRIYTPEGGKDHIMVLSEALYPSLGLDLVNQENLEIIEYQSNVAFKIPDFEVLPIPVIHAPESHPHGFRIDFGNKVLGFSGDTEWTDAIYDIASGADLMMLECNNYDSIRPGHCSYTQILKNRHNLPARLILNHFGEEMLKNIDEIEIEMAEDGGVVTL